MFTQKQLELIFKKTAGHCHFCGDKLELRKYGIKDIADLTGVWEADHVIQRAKGGRKDALNCLPACARCNRLRWHRKGRDIRELIFLGLILKAEIRKKSDIGIKVLKIRKERLKSNESRRRNNR